MKVCFVGAGSIGKRHMRNLKRITDEMNIDLVIHLLRYTGKALDDDLESIVEKTVTDVSELDESYDAIFITNPTHKHYDTMMHLKTFSKAFFVEKPVVDDISIDLSDFRDENGFVYYVACPLRYTHVLLRAKELLQDKDILSVRAISSSYLPEWRPGTDYRQTYSAHKEQGGGVMIDLIHEWDYLISLFGVPKKCLMTYGTFSQLEIDSEDVAAYIGVYADKLIEVHLDYFGKQVRRNFEVITEDDVWLFDIANSRISRNGVVTEVFSEEPNDKYVKELQYFLRLINHQETNSNTVAQAIEVMKVACGGE